MSAAPIQRDGMSRQDVSSFLSSPPLLTPPNNRISDLRPQHFLRGLSRAPGRAPVFCQIPDNCVTFSECSWRKGNGGPLRHPAPAATQSLPSRADKHQRRLAPDGASGVTDKKLE